MYVRADVTSTRVWGYAPLGKFLFLGVLRLIMVPLLGDFCMVEAESSFASAGSLFMAITATSEKHGRN